MTGIGTLVNVCAIILGGFLGLLFKGGLKQHYQDAVLRCLGLCTLFIGAAGGLSGLLSVSGTRLESGGSLGMILSLVLGTLVGERLNLEGRLGQFGRNRFYVKNYLVRLLFLSICSNPHRYL